MSNSPTKTFDAVHMVRSIRDDISTQIINMSTEQENRWLRSREFADPRLRRLMELAAQPGAAAGGAKDAERRG